MKFNLISYKGLLPKIGKDVVGSSTSTARGNTVLGSKCILKDRVVLRGDGAEIIVGNEVTFLDRSTVHVASDLMGSYIGDGSIIGRFSLVHACKIGKSVILGDQAIVMDGSQIGDNCIIAGQVGFAGSTVLGNNVMIGGQAGISGHLKIGNNVQIAGGSGVVDDISDNAKVMGYPAKSIKMFLKESR